MKINDYMEKLAMLVQDHSDRHKEEIAQIKAHLQKRGFMDEKGQFKTQELKDRWHKMERDANGRVNSDFAEKIRGWTKQAMEDAMVSADIAPSSAKNMGQSGRGASAFKNYVAKNRKSPGKVGMYKYAVPKFSELMKRY